MYLPCSLTLTATDGIKKHDRGGRRKRNQTEGRHKQRRRHWDSIRGGRNKERMIEKYFYKLTLICHTDKRLQYKYIYIYVWINTYNVKPLHTVCSLGRRSHYRLDRQLPSLMPELMRWTWTGKCMVKKHIHILYAIHRVKTWVSFAACRVCARAFWLARFWLAETGRRHTVRQVCLHDDDGQHGTWTWRWSSSHFYSFFQLN